MPLAQRGSAIGALQRDPQVSAGGDSQLREHLAQGVLDRSRADEQLAEATELTGVTFTPGAEMLRTAADTDEPDREPRLLPSTLPPGGYRKYRCTGPVESVTLHAADGLTLTMTWTAPVPVHVQLWVDNAGIGPLAVVAPEPAIAAGDDPVSAQKAAALPVLDPGGSLAFSVTCIVVQ